MNRKIRRNRPQAEMLDREVFLVHWNPHPSLGFVWKVAGVFLTENGAVLVVMALS